MATPAFIYGCDLLGPERFAQLCGQIFGAYYKSFCFGGVGQDGGVDGEFFWGELPASDLPLSTPVQGASIHPGELVIFQFKHVTVARSGEQDARERLFKKFQCDPTVRGKPCDLHRDLIGQKKPSLYILVTNVEINAYYRQRLLLHLKKHNPAIARYLVLGLDELEAQVWLLPELGQRYFPAIFGTPRFHLHLRLSTARPTSLQGIWHPEVGQILTLSVLNVGMAPSYIGQIEFEGIIGDWTTLFEPERGSEGQATLERFHLQNPPFGTRIDPGRRQDYYFHYGDWISPEVDSTLQIVPCAIYVRDEIGYCYRELLSGDIQRELTKWIKHRRSYK